MANSYSALGRWFEYLNDDCGYEQWSQYLIELLKEHKAGACGLDIGCGNGYFTRALTRARYCMTGIDISPEMLDTAQKLSLKQGIRAEFLLGDIAKLKVNAKADFAIAVNDCINYVPKSRLSVALAHVHSCLKKGATFIFDISTAHKLKTILGNNLFAEDRDDITYLWFNRLEEDRVVMDLTFFERGEDGRFTRYDERHVQYIYEQQEVENALKNAGFEYRVEGHLNKDTTERINFICKRL